MQKCSNALQSFAVERYINCNKQGFADRERGADAGEINTANGGVYD